MWAELTGAHALDAELSKLAPLDLPADRNTPTAQQCESVDLVRSNGESNKIQNTNRPVPVGVLESLLDTVAGNPDRGFGATAASHPTMTAKDREGERK